MRRVVRGFWGPRMEPATALADRWQRTLDRLAELLPAAGPGAGTDEGWTWRYVPSDGPATELRPDQASLLAALRAEQAADGWSDRTGYGLELVVGNEAGWKIDISGRAGGASEFVLQAIIIRFNAPDGAATPDAALLALVADVWQPDFGGVTDDDVLDALEDDADFGPDEPAVGWVGYLSPGRAALLPDDLKAAREELPAGGVLLDVAPRTDIESVVRANVQLRDSGALQPLPRPLERALL